MNFYSGHQNVTSSPHGFDRELGLGMGMVFGLFMSAMETPGMGPGAYGVPTNDWRVRTSLAYNSAAP